MFEAILEKILVNNVGPYINGIDKKNLKVGIWSGDVVISNISIKSEIIKMLGLPFVMKYSFVGKLTLKVSWKSIASRPVELNIEDVFIILQPLDQEKWTVQDDSELFAKRMEIVESLMQNFTQKILEKAKDGQKAAEEQGMVGKLTEKVIDNLQVIINFYTYISYKTVPFFSTFLHYLSQKPLYHFQKSFQNGFCNESMGKQIF